LPHWPSAPPLAGLFFCKHDWQTPLQAVLQHTFSTQNPLAHSLFCAHAVPLVDAKVSM
jgi:hypothetical protein